MWESMVVYCCTKIKAVEFLNQCKKEGFYSFASIDELVACWDKYKQKLVMKFVMTTY